MATTFWERFTTWLTALFRPRAEQSVTEIYDEIEALADTLDASIDHLFEVGQRKKIEAEDEIAALARQITRIDNEIAHTLELAKKAQSLQEFVRNARNG